MEGKQTWFCPKCWTEVGRNDRTCPACGANIEAEDQVDYELKLIRALDHRMSDRRLIAARVLGEIRSRKAVPALNRLARSARDPYVSAQAVASLASIGGRSARSFLHEATSHPSAVVRRAALAALAALESAPRSGND